MKMYEQYIFEREGARLIKTDFGFIAYKINFPFCIITECFVLEEFREKKHGKFLADAVFQVCKDAGVKTVQCQTDDNASNVKISKNAILSFGFKYLEKKESITYYELEVSEWEA